MAAGQVREVQGAQIPAERSAGRVVGMKEFVVAPGATSRPAIDLPWVHPHSAPVPAKSFRCISPPPDNSLPVFTLSCLPLHGSD